MHTSHLERDRRWDLPPRRANKRAISEELQARRGMLSTPLCDPEPGMELSRLMVGEVSCVLCQPSRPVATLLWFHGGGYRLGSAVNSARFGMRIAGTTDARVVLVDYALAPEHPFPAALHDAVSTYIGALDRWPEAVLVGGDSAGGGLAIALGVAAGRAGAKLPQAEILLSPWCDLTVSAGTYQSNATTDRLFSAASAAEAADLYLQGWDPTDPLASPLYANLTGFPPTLVLASTDEVLLDDSRRLADQLAAARIDVAAHFVPGVQHVWPTLDLDSSASIAALDEIGRFVNRIRSEPSSSAGSPVSVRP